MQLGYLPANRWTDVTCPGLISLCYVMPMQKPGGMIAHWEPFFPIMAGWLSLVTLPKEHSSASHVAVMTGLGLKCIILEMGQVNPLALNSHLL